MRTIFLSLVFLAGVSVTASAQFKIGGKSINTKKLVNAASDVANAATLSDADVAAMAKEYIQWMDTHNEVAGPDTEMGQRLERITANLKKIDGLDLNFKVYNVIDVNAFACGDGSVRVCGGLMKVMDDNEVLAVIGHEIGHVVHTDSKDAMKSAYMTSAAKNAVGSVSGTVAKLTDSQLGDLAEALANAQYSQKQESEADDYGFKFSVDNGQDPYSMHDALKKLMDLSDGQPKSSKYRQMFSSHPDTQKRVERMKAKAEEYSK
ncbi:M48 family metallopeptidase [Parabacteroides bouchesdurhonensis]|uniref:M48 family metallopeptidase n=1 Tax=Parabacteroides bouchesdurhonensis TaxID=1936995 RepID=UPI000E4FF4BC|nr:M48 family metallopeptidase [Parabacteroides bouchesdurhonensis]RHJ92499.1 peptidase M48 [Bacteroides sp. AM07-16]